MVGFPLEYMIKTNASTRPYTKKLYKPGYLFSIIDIIKRNKKTKHIMKKFLLALVICFISIATVFAQPRNIFRDEFALSFVYRENLLLLMTTTKSILKISINTLLLLSILGIACSCGTRKNRTTKELAVPSKAIRLLVEIAPEQKEETAPEQGLLPPIEEVYRAAEDGKVHFLSKQRLTSAASYEAAFDNKVEGDYFHEPTPATDAFILSLPASGGPSLYRILQTRYNYAAVMNRVLHSYEWFHRVSCDAMDEEEHTMKDTLAWVKKSQPNLSESFISQVIPDKTARNGALRFLSAYRHFDGKDGEESDFSKAFQELNATFDKLPRLASEQMLDQFEEGFWDWYDKEQFVPGINRLVRMHMKGYDGEGLTAEHIFNLIEAIEKETDIDRRTILALELVKFEQPTGVILLGDILESGIYTRYLFEAWLSWRANAQSLYSPSSYSEIPNNYYDKLRVCCLNTLMSHCLDDDGLQAVCLAENMLLANIIHRMGSIAGNSSMTHRMHLSYDWFIAPNAQFN